MAELNANDFIRNLDSFQKELLESAKALDTLNASMIAFDKNLKTTSSSTQKVINSRNQLNTNTSKLTAEEKKLQQIYKASEKTTLRTAVAEDQLRQKRAALRQEAQKLNKSQKTLGKWWGTITKQVLSAGAAMFGVQAAIALVTKGLKSFFNITRDFTKEAAVLSGVLGKTRKETEALQQSAIKIGGTFPVTANEVLKLQTAYARLGFSQKEIMDLTEPTVKGSMALNSGLDETAALVGAVVNTFDNFSSVDAPEILNMMANSTNQSALSFEKLNTSLPIVAGAANAAGISFSETLSLLGKLSDAGIDASSSSTALRNIFIESAKQGLSYDQILDKIVNSQDKLTVANDEFGKRAAVSATVLANNRFELKDLKGTIENVSGTLDDMAKEQMNTLDGAVKGLASAWERLILGFKNSEGVIMKLIQAFTGFINKISDAKQEGGAMLAAFTVLFQLLAQNFKSLGKILQMFFVEPLKSGIKIINAIFARDFKSIGGIVKDFIKEEKKNAKEYVDGWRDSIDKVKKSYKGSADGIKEISGDLTEEELAELAKRKKAFEDSAMERMQAEKEITEKQKIEIEKRKKEMEKMAEFVKNLRDKANDEISKSLDEQIGVEVEKYESFLDEINRLAEETDKFLEDVVNESIDTTIKQGEEEIKAFKHKEEEKQKLIQETIDFATGLDNQLFEYKQVLLENEIMELEAKNKRGEISEEAFANEVAAIKKKQAETAKQGAIIDAVINTAVGVTQALAQEGPIGIITGALVAAAGALEIATISAQNIPAFAEGVEGFAGGMAVVGDGGRNEVIRTPDGKLHLTPETATLAYLPTGSDVIPSIPEAISQYGGISNEKMDELINETKSTRKAIMNRTESNVMIGRRGIRNMIKKGNNSIKMIDYYRE